MRSKFKFYKVVTVMLIVFLCVMLQMFVCADSDFHRAINIGARAEIVLSVTDEENVPVNGAQINVFFEAGFRSVGKEKTFVTDTNGVALISGRTGKAVLLRTTKEGYYGSNDKICYVTIGQGAKGGHWLPLILERKMVLRRRLQPGAEMPHINSPRYTKVTGEWLGFDLAKYDFVAPAGEGSCVDMELKFDWNGQSGTNFNGMDVSIRFTEPYSGAYYYDRIMMSDFKDAYCASTNAVYDKKFVYYSHPVKDANGMTIKREQKLFDQTKSLVVRSRCKVDADGSLKEARYSEISELTFGCVDKGAWIMFQPIFNTKPNDTNLEPK